MSNLRNRIKIEDMNDAQKRSFLNHIFLAFCMSIDDTNENVIKFRIEESSNKVLDELKVIHSNRGLDFLEVELEWVATQALKYVKGEELVDMKQRSLRIAEMVEGETLSHTPNFAIA